MRDEHKAKLLPCSDAQRPKRVLGIMASILTAIHMSAAGDPFGTPAGSPESDTLISASVQWAERRPAYRATTNCGIRPGFGTASTNLPCPLQIIFSGT
jgi:hypothetical protein